MRSYDLTQAADDDLMEIWRFSYRRWGASQADTYFDKIIACCEAVGGGTALSRPVRGLADDIRSLRCQRHVIFFPTNGRPVILAILHDRMQVLKRLVDRL